MNTNKKNVLIATEHSYLQKGNLFCGFSFLEQLLNNDGKNLVYFLPLKMKNLMWVEELNRVYFMSGNLIKDAHNLREIIKKENIKIVNTHFLSPKYTGIFKLATKSVLHTKFMRYIHMLYVPKNNIIKEKLKQFFAFGDINVACSKSCYDTMKKANIKNITTITNGIDFSSLKTTPMVHDGINILMFGYDYVNKGVKIAVGAVQKLNRDDVKLQICVTTDFHIIRENIIKDFGIFPSFIEFLPKTTDVSKYYRNADIFLSSGSIESYCYALREAIYCGVKTVASNIPAHKTKCDTTYFKADDMCDLTNALKISIAKNIDVETQRKIIEKNDSIEKWATKMYELIKKVS